MLEGEQNHRHNTSLKTFRLPAELLFLLEREAESEETTINALTSTILKKHVEWGSKNRKLGTVTVSRTLLATLLEASDEHRLTEFARRNMPVAWRDMARFWFGDTTLEGVIHFFSEYSKHAGLYEFEARQTHEQYCVSFRHELGSRFSLFLASAGDELLRSEYHIQPVIETSDSLVTFIFPTR